MLRPYKYLRFKLPPDDNAIRRMRGLLKTDQPAPKDEEVAAMLEKRRTEKYSGFRSYEVHKILG
ncbi:MAG: hypothetical protein WBB29_09570 [Geitlerinemataceae cyanobacterium]